jgi:GT2 family glycosyltransferase
VEAVEVSARTPEISVVVPSHDRPYRLRWLMNALEEQTLSPDRFEVLVGHDSSGPETEELLRTHPLAAAGVLKGVQLAAGSAPPGANRNAALRLARAPVIAFTDDDCRPPRHWLEAALEAVRRHPGAILQGRTRPDPHEDHLMQESHAQSQHIDPPSHFAQACNILYPRELVERLGGFDEELESGEDVDLAMRAMKAGASYIGAPEMLTWHAVAVPSLLGRLRALPRWRYLPALLKRHPEHRRAYTLSLFLPPHHAFVPLAAAAVPLSRRNPLYACLAVPWLVLRVPKHGGSPRGRYRALTEIPGRAALDLAEFAVLVWGSIRHRSILL